MRRGVKRFLLLLATIFVILGIGALIIWQSNIETITVTGNNFYKDSEIIDMIFEDKLQENTVFCYLENRFNEHKSVPFVERYQIEIKNRHEIEIVIYEKNIIGYINYMGSYMYFDRDGVVVESSTEKKKGIVEVTGISFSNIVIGEAIALNSDQRYATLFDDILLMTQMFEKYDLNVKTINFEEQSTETDNGIAYIRNVKVLVKNIVLDLGTTDFIDQKIASASDILPNLKGLKGTLHLNRVTTAAADNGVYYFTVDPEEETKSEAESEGSKKEND